MMTGPGGPRFRFIGSQALMLLPCRRWPYQAGGDRIGSRQSFWTADERRHQSRFRGVGAFSRVL